jgi:hypothetical protein
MGFEPTYPTPYTVCPPGSAMEWYYSEKTEAPLFQCQCVHHKSQVILLQCSLVARYFNYSARNLYIFGVSKVQQLLVWLPSDCIDRLRVMSHRPACLTASWTQARTWRVRPSNSGRPHSVMSGPQTFRIAIRFQMCADSESQEVESRDPWKYNRFVLPVVEYNLVSAALLCVFPATRGINSHCCRKQIGQLMSATGTQCCMWSSCLCQCQLSRCRWRWKSNPLETKVLERVDGLHHALTALLDVPKRQIRHIRTMVKIHGRNM